MHETTRLPFPAMRPGLEDRSEALFLGLAAAILAVTAAILALALR